jgi:hypothetical protein
MSLGKNVVDLQLQVIAGGGKGRSRKDVQGDISISANVVEFLLFTTRADLPQASDIMQVRVQPA